MSTLHDIQRHIEPELAALNRRIGERLMSSNTLINTIVSNYLTTKGKQIRPIIVLLSARMFGAVNENVIAAASAVELLHNSSLIHDDVVDESKLRRGAPTVNCTWDNHIAVLIGDFFLATSLREAVATGDLRVVHSISELGKLLSVGELDQIYNARYHTLTEEAYFEIIYRKTASLFVACAEAGCFTMNVDDDRLERMRRFAELLGLCFQIRDDIFDYYDSEEVGKPTGNDLLEGKITLPLLHALLGEDEECKEMTALSRRDELNPDEIARLIDFAKRRGGIDYAYAKMHELRNQAAEIMATFPPTEETAMFMSLFDYIISRPK